MVGEGAFPKADTDVLYASEVNRFALASTSLGYNTNATRVDSGANFTTIGSLYVGPGSLASFSQINFRGMVWVSAGSNNTFCMVTFSGQHAGTGSIQITSRFGDSYIFLGEAMLGSPGSGWLTMESRAHQVIGSTFQVQTNMFLNNFNVGSAFSILFSLRQATTGSAMMSTFGANAFRGGF